MCMTGKCAGIQLIIAGILFGLVSFSVFSAWLNLAGVFAIMAIIAGIHSFVHSSECCEMPNEKPKKKR